MYATQSKGNSFVVFCSEKFFLFVAVNVMKSFLKEGHIESPFEGHGNSLHALTTSKVLYSNLIRSFFPK